MTNYQPRKQTIASSTAAMLALIGEGLDIPGHEALRAVKRVATHIGLHTNDLLLLEALVSLTTARDWNAGSRPVVWPSDEELQGMTGFSRDELNRHMETLVRTGLVSFHDSFDGSGSLTGVLGFDLAPMAARTAELEWLEEALDYERSLGFTPDDEAQSHAPNRLSLVSNLGPATALGAFKARVQSLVSALPRRSASTTSLRTVSKSFLGFWSGQSQAVLENPQYEQQAFAGYGCVEPQPFISNQTGLYPFDDLTEVRSPAAQKRTRTSKLASMPQIFVDEQTDHSEVHGASFKSLPFESSL
jgi:Replication protein C N-terminal domain